MQPRSKPTTVIGHIKLHARKVTLAVVITTAVKELVVEHPIDLCIDLISGAVVEVLHPTFGWARERYHD